MERDYIQINAMNMITIPLMAIVGYTILAALYHLFMMAIGMNKAS